jgi:hypothetical protein
VRNIKYVSDELKNDKAFALKAINQEGYNIQ